jgi:hypothetical protein
MVHGGAKDESLWLPSQASCLNLRRFLNTLSLGTLPGSNGRRRLPVAVAGFDLASGSTRMLTKEELDAIRQIVREELAEHLHPTKFRTGQIRGEIPVVGPDPFMPCERCGKAPCECPED